MRGPNCYPWPSLLVKGVYTVSHCKTPAATKLKTKSPFKPGGREPTGCYNEVIVAGNGRRGHPPPLRRTPVLDSESGFQPRLERYKPALSVRLVVKQLHSFIPVGKKAESGSIWI